MRNMKNDGRKLLKDGLKAGSVKMIACLLAASFLMVGGCSSADKKGDKAAAPTSTAQQQSKSENSPEAALAKFGVKGKVISSTFGSTPEGFMANVDNRIYLVDLKNNQIASVENFAYVVNDMRTQQNSGSSGRIIPQFLIYDDKHGKDDDKGEWRNNNHFLPVYIVIKFDGAGNVRPDGNMSSGAGAAPSHYQGYLQEQKNIDLGNLFLKTVVPFTSAMVPVTPAPAPSRPATPTQPGSASAPKSGTKMELTAGERQKLSVFFSNFAEAWGNNTSYSFSYDGATAEQLTIFGIKHNAINRKSVMVDGYKVPVAEVKAAVRKYLGRDFNPYTNDKWFSYGGNCIWINTKGAGLSMGDATLQSMYNNGDGTYTAYVTVNAIEELSAEVPPAKRTWQAVLTVSPYDSSRYVLRAWKRM